MIHFFSLSQVKVVIPTKLHLIRHQPGFELIHQLWPPEEGLPIRLTLTHHRTHQADWQRAGIGTTMPHSCVIRLRMRQ